MKNSPLGNRDLIRSINRSIILNTIKTYGTIGRAEIARLTDLSPATVSGITAELIQDGLVVEKEPGDSSGGRRPILLAINPLGGFVVGVKVMEDHVLGALVDMEATLLAKHSLPLAQTTPEAVAQALGQLVTGLLAQAADQAAPTHPVSGEAPAAPRLLGMGVGLAGIIDSTLGVVRQSPYFGWRNVPLRDLIQEQVQLPVYLDNDVNTLAYTEKWYGGGQGLNDFLVVTVGRGVGLGMVINGQFIHGSRGGAGEFGHTLIFPGGLACTCGNQGCLEAYVSEPAMLLQAEAAFHNGELSRCPQTPDELVALAQEGEPAAQAIFARAGALLGQSIANLVNLLNPECILVNGEGVRAGKWLFDPMCAAIEQHTMPGLRGDTAIRIEPLGDDAWARGAASLVLHELFESPFQRSQDAELA
jgi:predicted NBD/HSP70 family sugar kinase